MYNGYIQSTWHLIKLLHVADLKLFKQTQTHQTIYALVGIY